MFFVCLACSLLAATTLGAQYGQARGGGDDTGGGIIPGAIKMMPLAGGGAGDTINLVQTTVRLVDGAGYGIGRIWITLRDEMGQVVAVERTDGNGFALMTTEGPVGDTLEAVQVGVAGVPFVPGASVLIVVDV